jgi:hydroxyacylglutathione hydrolase
VEIAGTLEEGDDVSGFSVVHLPGHAPGLIALFRESDRLALTTDCFYVIDPETSRTVPPGPPALTGDVRAQLERAAAA